MIENGQVIDIFSERDIVYSLSEQGAAVLERRVRDVMTGPPVTVERNTSVLAALSLITRPRRRQAPMRNILAPCLAPLDAKIFRPGARTPDTGRALTGPSARHSHARIARSPRRTKNPASSADI